MTTPDPFKVGRYSADDLLDGVGTIFGFLGRALLCLGPGFRVVHASSSLDDLLGEGAARESVGRTAEELLGGQLFGPDAGLRRALESGQRREGWGATVRVGERPSRSVSLTAAPIVHHAGGLCDPRIQFVVVVRPIEESLEGAASAPTIFAGMVARSPSMLRIFQLVEILRESDATVLIGGDSGTGKELVARAIHLHSPRRSQAFVAVNCGALPPDLLESELFGHVRGAFTGAVRDRAGRFELAHGGTLFLDEIAELPLHLQVKLLRVLQERVYERVGESRSHEVDTRVIAATNRNLRAAVADGSFREDLYYRLRVVPIEIPPLRLRREDIEPLAQHLLGRVCRRYDRSLRLAPETLRTLLAYDWPGNVRELENALEYAVAVTQGQTITPQDLPEEVRQPHPRPPALAQPRAHAASPGGGRSSGADDDERARILAALERNHWRRTAAAEELGISRSTLWRRMRELRLDA